MMLNRWDLTNIIHPHIDLIPLIKKKLKQPQNGKCTLSNLLEIFNECMSDRIKKKIIDL